MKIADRVHINNDWALVWYTAALHKIQKITKKSLVYSGNLYPVETKLTWLVSFRERVSPRYFSKKKNTSTMFCL